MAKKMLEGSFPCLPHHGWHDVNRAPYDTLVEYLCEDKSEEERKRIIEEVEESFTYLLICELGSNAPLQIDLLYEMEQKDGVIGFIYYLLHNEPHFRNKYNNYEISKKRD